MGKAKKPWNHPDTIARFWDRVEMDPKSGCFLFLGALDRGWGRLKVWGLPGCPGGLVWAHRYAYALEHGPVEIGSDVHHRHDRCSNRNCVNVDHLEPVGHDTHGEVSRDHQLQAERDPWASEIYSEPIL